MIVIFGDFQFGKSSLLNRIQDHLPSNVKIIHFDVAGKRTDDTSLFVNSFFDKLSAELGTKLNSWDEIAKLTDRSPILIVIDEFGGIADNTKLAAYFVPQLVFLARRYNVRIVVSIPIEKGPMEKFINNLGSYDPKLWKYWHPIVVDPLTREETFEILSLLPHEIFLIVKENMDTILSKSKGHPQHIQCLCRLLFDRYKDGSSAEDLTSLINQDASYDE